MKVYSNLETSTDNGVMTVWLNRPDVHNAFDETMLHELADCFETIGQEALCVILRGRGKSFCAGVDLNWMKSAALNSY